MNGFGILKQSNGVTYEGEFQNSLKQGRGKLYYDILVEVEKQVKTTVYVFVGEFKNDLKNGFGIEKKGEESIDGGINKYRMQKSKEFGQMGNYKELLQLMMRLASMKMGS